jgi:DNA-binding XRE family transcriptional regulator
MPTLSTENFPHGETSLGERLRAFRKEKRQTLKELSELIGISHGTLSDIETGKTKPSADTLASLCRNADISIEWLLTGNGEPYSKGESETSTIRQPSASCVCPNIPPPAGGQPDNGSGANAADAFSDLLTLERLSPSVFSQACTLIQEMVDALKTAASKQGYFGKDRRVRDRRQEDNPAAIPDTGDQRSGLDRRKAAAA